MPEPEDVNHSRFPVDAVVFNHDNFSVAWGTWEDKGKTNKLLGMRWNHDAQNPNGPGYPKLFGNPVWFIIPEELTVPFLKGLLVSEHSNKRAIERVLAELGHKA